MSRQLSPLAIIEIIEMVPNRYPQRMGICEEWKNLWLRYVAGRSCDGTIESRLPKEALKSRDEYDLAVGRKTKSEAIRMIFSSGGPVTLYGTIPKWLIPAVVEVSCVFFLCAFYRTLAYRMLLSEAISHALLPELACSGIEDVVYIQVFTTCRLYTTRFEILQLHTDY